MTLTGPGGIGKTSLALSILSERRDAGEATWFVDLSRTTDAAGVLEAVAVSLERSGSDDPERAIDELLGRLEGLLLLDNVEGVVGPEVSSLIGARLAAAPGIRIVATSRVPLGIDGEIQHLVPGLGLPEGDDPSAVARSPAGALFLARSVQQGSPLILDPQSASDLAAVLRRLDGIPLAIELAAGRSRVLTPTGLRRRLDEPATLARGRAEDGDRHGSLARVLDLTIGLLNRDEHSLLAALAVCPGSFDLDLAEALAPSIAVVPALDALAAAGLVTPDGELAGERRFRMLETIRAHITGALSQEDRDRTMSRLALYVATVARSLHVQLRGPAQGAAIARATADRPMIAAVLDWAVGHDPALGLEILVSLDHYWGRAPDSAAPLRWLTALLERAPAADPSRPYAELLHVELLLRYRNPAVAEAHLPDVMAVAEASGSRRLRRTAFIQASEVYWALGRTTLLGQALLAAAGCSDDADDADALRLVGEAHLAIAAGEFDVARDLLLTSATAHGRRGSRWNEGITLFTCAEVDWRLGHPAVAAVTARTADRLVSGAGGELDARDVLVTALAVAGEVGAARDVLRAAWAVVEHAIPIARTELVESVIPLLAAEGRPDEAMTALVVARRERERTGWVLDPMTAWLLDRLDRNLAHELGPVRTTLAVRAAESATLDTVVTGAQTPAARHASRSRRETTSLTAREVEVLVLVAQGRSDAEIADELFISRKTASVHVANIKGKLGLATRLQVALHARAIGLTPSGPEPAVN